LINTSAFIEELIKYLNTLKSGFKVYYERADKKRTFPYGIVSGLNATELNAGDLVSFDLDIWTDYNLPSATVEIESLCDLCRNALTNKVISSNGVFGSHVGYEGRDTTDDREDDISHRRLFFAARIFYI
jgi:hypothetical protein